MIILCWYQVNGKTTPCMGKDFYFGLMVPNITVHTVLFFFCSVVVKDIFLISGNFHENEMSGVGKMTFTNGDTYEGIY